MLPGGRSVDGRRVLHAVRAGGQREIVEEGLRLGGQMLRAGGPIAADPGGAQEMNLEPRRRWRQLQRERAQQS